MKFKYEWNALESGVCTILRRSVKYTKGTASEDGGALHYLLVIRHQYCLFSLTFIRTSFRNDYTNSSYSYSGKIAVEERSLHHSAGKFYLCISDKESSLF